MDRHLVHQRKGREARGRFRVGAAAGDRIADPFWGQVEGRMP
ncbi:MAG TPA: hypothetical protein PLQ97_04285 [Myxococcota bacterium]|nr:hypothetical protein [Myxococcota bacterium]HQK49925.1 hypothetical protein [Myxococcota bacterium]